MSQTGRMAASAIHQILGDIDETLVSAIQDTGATEAELLEAIQWIRADDQLGTSLVHGPQGVVRQPYELLRANEAGDER